MIGDRYDVNLCCIRLDTDIAFGQNHGVKTLLVYTGVAKRSDPLVPVEPDFSIDSLTQLANLMNLPSH